ncbi:MAG TPA: hypothetical protein QGF02_00595 [Candidatus Babeliales bacterium]|nr:hypothetical protein [Candidatus Babeliales bacterium]
MKKFLHVLGLSLLFITGAAVAKVDIAKKSESVLEQANTNFGDALTAVNAAKYAGKDFTDAEYIQHATVKSLKAVAEDVAANKLSKKKGGSKDALNLYKRKIREGISEFKNLNKKLSKEKPTEFELIKNTKKSASELEYLKKFIEANKVYFETARLLNKVKKEFEEEIGMKGNMKKLLSHIRVDREAHTLTKVIGVLATFEDFDYPLHSFNDAVTGRVSQLSGKLSKIMNNKNLYKTDMELTRKEKEVIGETIEVLSEFTDLGLVKLSKQLSKDLNKNKVMLESYRPFVKEIVELIKTFDDMVYKIVETPEYKKEDQKQQRGQMARVEWNTLRRR